MRRDRTAPWILGALLALPLALGPGGAPAGASAEGVPPDFASAPPAAAHPGDPADSLYQAARQALGRGDYDRAARDFGRIVDRYPDSEYAPDALYWKAFALYRQGDGDALDQALDALRVQRQRYPDAATRGDADALAIRIQGELARRGDAESAYEVARVASRAAGDSTPDCDEPTEKMETRIAALNALLQMDADRAVPILKRVLERRDACSVELRRKAVFLVAQHETDDTAAILVRVAEDDPDTEVRENAVFWLSQVDSDDAVDALREILRTSPDPAVREKALFALSQQGSEGARQALRDFAERSDAPEDLREKAIFWIGQEGAGDDAAYLRGLFGKLSDPALRERILFSVSQMDDPGSMDWLLDVAADGKESMELRKKALFWAGQIAEASGGADRLLSLYDRVDDPALKEQLVFVYAQMGTPAAMDRLFDIARHETDPDLRKKAIFWIGQSDDPRAAKFLEETITQ